MQNAPFFFTAFIRNNAQYIMTIGMGCFLLACSSVKDANHCSKQPSSGAEAACVDSEVVTNNAELDQTYAQLMTKTSPKGQAQLRKARQAWLAYRQEQCVFDTMGMEDASLYSTLLSYCYQDFTTQQIRQLQTQLHCKEGEMPCGGQ